MSNRMDRVNEQRAERAWRADRRKAASPAASAVGLLAFLRARHDEAAEAARRVPGSGRWSAYIEGGGDGWAIEDAEEGDPAAVIGDESMTRHIARHDPARTLRDVATNRRIVDHCEAVLSSGDGEAQGLASMVLLELASEHDDHEDYREGWRL